MTAAERCPVPPTACDPNASRSAFLVLVTLVIAGVVSGCASPRPRNPVPKDLIETASPTGFPDVRIWGDYNDPAEVERMMSTRAATLERRFAREARSGKTPKLSYLAISGGGQYGAFTAGVLTAWTRTGSRPAFEMVTGISTGAIIAPFAFLGTDYDPVLQEIYTSFKTDSLVEKTFLSGIISGAALLDTTPLRDKIETYVTPALLAEIAEEHRSGRRLLIGTTNIDAGRSVIWDMGAIAASGRPGALGLFRDVILASAAIPMAFPPVFFEVGAGGETYEEMHVDGGVTSQVNVLSPQIPHFMMRDRLGFDIDRELYVIVNGAVRPPPKPVPARTHEIASASIDALWYAQSVGDLYKIHAIATRDEIDVRYAWIPESFTLEPEERFDPKFMRALFDLGSLLMESRQLWHPYPPNYTARVATAGGDRALMAPRN